MVPSIETIPRKFISVDKLHRLGWTRMVEIEDGVKKLYEWYQESLNVQHSIPLGNYE